MLGPSGSGATPVNKHVLVKRLPAAQEVKSGILMNNTAGSDVERMQVLDSCARTPFKTGDHVWVDKAGQHRLLRTLADDEFFVRAHAIVGWKKAD